MNHALTFLLALSLATLSGGCAATTGHAVGSAAAPFAPSSGAALEATLDEPGPVTVETVVAADWVVDRGGLVNLDHPRAKAARLVDGDEPIKLYLHAIRHPTRGLYLVDSGVERAFRDAPGAALLHGMTAGLAHLDKMTTHTLTGDWLAAHAEPVRGVLLTHLHLDHVLGLRDLPASTPIYVGSGDAKVRTFENVFLSGIFDASLADKGPLEELSFRRDPSGRFAGVLDLFGDGTFWAIAGPGHTPGSTAFVARTPRGPVLLTGDACHTAWGWENGVEPGSFSRDKRASAASLASLLALAARHPSMEVRLGHQEQASTTPAR
jgi:glyoxylase-like metal-dependent hydrolase (beta-lactamase superfamily II)